MNRKCSNAHQFLLAFARELNGVQSDERNYASPPLRINGVQFRYYFSRKDVSNILLSKGRLEIGLLESIYEYEDFLKQFILETTEERTFPDFVSWINQKNYKIILKKNDITLRA